MVLQTRLGAGPAGLVLNSDLLRAQRAPRRDFHRFSSERHDFIMVYGSLLATPGRSPERGTNPASGGLPRTSACRPPTVEVAQSWQNQVPIVFVLTVGSSSS